MADERVRIWAPRASERVEVLIGERRVALQRGQHGWWQSAEELREHGTDYAFSLDGGDARPDPRSPWQPAGPHGRSRWLDHARHAWQDADWQPPAWPSAIVYELHIGTFTPEGTFDSAIERLDDLAALGITHVELLPVAEFPGEHGWGYDGVDLFAPHHAYGGPEGLKRLVDAAHARGLAMLLDVVYNHFGPDGNYLMEFGPYVSERHQTLWGGAVNLDGPGSDEVRRFFIDNAISWLRDYHFDGLRLDAVHAFVDTSAVHFLEQLSAEVDDLEAELGREVVLIAESDLGDPRIIRSREEHGYGMDAQWNDEFRHALHVTLTGEQDGIHGDFRGLEDLATALRDGFVYQGQRSAFRDRHHGRPLRDLPRWKLIAFMQNHDQSGNRALGERASQLLDPDALMVAAALVLLGPNVPMLFFGEEWAASTPFLYFVDHQDPDLAEAVRQGRRKEFEASLANVAEVPDPQAAETFAASKLKWDERSQSPHAAILEWHRRLIGHRRELPALAAGTWPTVVADADAGWLTVERNGTLLAVNVGRGPASLELPGLAARWRLETASREDVELPEGNHSNRLELPPMSVAFLLERPQGT